MSLTLGALGGGTENSITYMVCRLCKANPAAGDAYTTQAIINAYANEELQMLASESRSVRKTNIGSEGTTTAGTRLYATPADCLEVTNVYVGPANAGIHLEFRSTDYLNAAGGPGWWTRQGTPYYWYMDDQGTAPNIYQVGLWPIPGITGLKITLEYIAKGNTLAASGDIPLIDQRLDWALIFGTAARIMEDRRDPYFSELYRKRRDEILEKFMESGRGNRRPTQAMNHFSAASWED